MKNKSVQNCRFVHHAKFHCIVTTLNRLFKIEFERGGDWKRALLKYICSTRIASNTVSKITLKEVQFAGWFSIIFSNLKVRIDFYLSFSIFTCLFTYYYVLRMRICTHKLCFIVSLILPSWDCFYGKVFREKEPSEVPLQRIKVGKGNRIINGVDANITKHPWAAYIKIKPT